MVAPSRFTLMISSGISKHRVDVAVKRIGGGFGGKETRTVPFTMAVAVASQATGRCVVLVHAV